MITGSSRICPPSQRAAKIMQNEMKQVTIVMDQLSPKLSTSKFKLIYAENMNAARYMTGNSPSEAPDNKSSTIPRKKTDKSPAM